MASSETYFVGCCLLKIEVVILRVSITYEQVRELNYLPFKLETGLLRMLKHLELFDCS